MIANDPAERDLAWRGYSGWALLPGVSLTLVITITIFLVDWWLHVGIESSRSMLLGLAMLILWLIQFGRWCYRGITYTYRLTDRRIHVDRGFLHLPEPAVDLHTIADVRVEQRGWQRWCNFGTIRIGMKNGERIRLTGVWQPDEFAQLIRTNLPKS